MMIDNGPVILLHPNAYSQSRDDDMERTKIDHGTQSMEVKVARAKPKAGGFLKCVVAIVFAAIVGGTYVVGAYFEAEAFNRLTGKNVSTWDALFLELRIDGK
jgi:hypothetical protein